METSDVALPVKQEQPPVAGPRGERWPLLSIVALYLASFFLPAINPKGIDLPEVPGWFAFFMSFLVLQTGYPVVIANPAFWVGLLLSATRRWGGAALAGMVAVLLALIPLFYVPSPYKINHF